MRRRGTPSLAIPRFCPCGTSQGVLERQPQKERLHKKLFERSSLEGRVASVKGRLGSISTQRTDFYCVKSSSHMSCSTLMGHTLSREALLLGAAWEDYYNLDPEAQA